MAAVSIRNLDDDVKKHIRRRAAHHGVSMEEEMRRILTEAVRPAQGSNGLFSTLREAALEVGGVDLEVPTRDEPARHVDFESEHFGP